VTVVIGVDPGTVKAGYAVVDGAGKVLAQGIEPVDRLVALLTELVGRYQVSTLALGRGTNARAFGKSLAAIGPPVAWVDEFETTRHARTLYFVENPPRGWRRLLPVSLQVPPRPVDDYAAVLIARRFLDQQAPQAVSPN
jgi:RNase H-fold protein (predicted Holliday junction resolvase)